jgi:hypothetical protein
MGGPERLVRYQVNAINRAHHALSLCAIALYALLATHMKNVLSYSKDPPGLPMKYAHEGMNKILFYTNLRIFNLKEFVSLNS